jgi:hypothetical protein
MREIILDILEKHYHGRNYIEERCAEELLRILQFEKDKSFTDGYVDATNKAVEAINKKFDLIV